MGRRRKRAATRPPNQPNRASSTPPNSADYTNEELQFMLAVDEWKRQHNRPHPTWVDILAIARALGYRKVQ